MSLSLRPRRHTRRTVASGAAFAVALSTIGALLGPGVGHASSHREAPYISTQPGLDNTDVYAFVSPDKPDTVTLIGNWVPLEEPNGGPSFYKFIEGAHYDFNIDNDGDAVPDTIYRWVFTNHYRAKNTFLYNTGVVTGLDDPDLNFYQTYTLQKLTVNGNGNATASTTLAANKIAAPSDVGPASMPDYADLRAEAVNSLTGGGQTYVGQADDPFFIDLRVFDLLYGADFSEVGHDTLAGYNVNTIALQVPKSELALNGDAQDNPVVGVWSTTDASHVTVASQTNGPGGLVQESKYDSQVSRLGNPLINEVVIPLQDKDKFNASTADHDTQFLSYVTDPSLAKLIENIYGISAPDTPRKDLVEIFLTGICGACGPIGVDLNSQRLNEDVSADEFVPAEELRLNMSIPPTENPNRLGVLGGDTQGFPNGRRLVDDVVDIALQAMEGAANTNDGQTDMQQEKASSLGDAVNSNDATLSATFPYVALPHHDSVNRPDVNQR